MNHPDFTQLRRLIDEAITFHELEKARELSFKALHDAQRKELLGEVMYFRAQLAIIEERFEDAIKDLDSAIKYNSEDGAAYNDRALCMVELGIIDGVMEYFDQGIKVEPDYATIHHNKGWFLNKLGLHQQALDCFKTALSIEPNRPVTYENMANAYELMGDIDNAIIFYKKALTFLGSRNTAITKQILKEIKRLQKFSR